MAGIYPGAARAFEQLVKSLTNIFTTQPIQWESHLSNGQTETTHTMAEVKSSGKKLKKPLSSRLTSLLKSENNLQEFLHLVASSSYVSLGCHMDGSF